VIGALAMVIFGVLKPREATASLPMSMLLLIVGALAMSGALSSTGAGDLIGGQIAKVVQAVGANSYIVGFIFFIIPFVLTQVMQNRGTMLIFHPIAIATCASIHANPVGLMILIQAACLSAFMTPMATSAIPYIMEVGGYDQRSMFKQSWLLSIICCVVSVFWIMTMFPLM
jgi:di/tricarboxylate transporter